MLDTSPISHLFAVSSSLQQILLELWPNVGSDYSFKNEFFKL
jgi:hypothetical protein